MIKKIVKWGCLLLLTTCLTGCFVWIRAYQTYLQMDEFDQNFDLVVDKEFSLLFKDPILYSEDFVSLSKIQPSTSQPYVSSKLWHYWFKKINAQNTIIQPEIKFYFSLNFNEDDRLTKLSLSPLFLQIAPPEFLEISIRSVGGAKINTKKRQLKADTSNIKKIVAELPLKSQVVSQLGEPLLIEKSGEDDIYIYHFILQTTHVEEGYEDRLLNVIRLTFNQSDKLVRMAGRFAGLKISINYQKYVK